MFWADCAGGCACIWLCKHIPVVRWKSLVSPKCQHFIDLFSLTTWILDFFQQGSQVWSSVCTLMLSMFRLAVSIKHTIDALPFCTKHNGFLPHCQSVWYFFPIRCTKRCKYCTFAHCEQPLHLHCVAHCQNMSIYTTLKNMRLNNKYSKSIIKVKFRIFFLHYTKSEETDDDVMSVNPAWLLLFQSCHPSITFM